MNDSSDNNTQPNQNRRRRSRGNMYMRNHHDWLSIDEPQVILGDINRYLQHTITKVEYLYNRLLDTRELLSSQQYSQDYPNLQNQFTSLERSDIRSSYNSRNIHRNSQPTQASRQQQARQTQTLQQLQNLRHEQGFQSPLIYEQTYYRTQPPNINTLLSGIFYSELDNNVNTTNTLEFATILNEFLNRVPIIATPEEISRSTVRTLYGSIENPLNTHCPITLEQLQQDTEVIELLGCRHVFTQASITNWFEHHACCPVCRYDIRTYHSEH